MALRRRSKASRRSRNSRSSRSDMERRSERARSAKSERGMDEDDAAAPTVRRNRDEQLVVEEEGWSEGGRFSGRMAAR